VYLHYLHYQQGLYLCFACLSKHVLLGVISQVLMIVLFDAWVREDIILKFLQCYELYCDLTSKSSQVFRGHLISPLSMQLLTQFNLAPSLAASACYCFNLDTETCWCWLFIEGGLLIRFVDSNCLGLQIKIVIIVNFPCWAWKFPGLLWQLQH
jgi:hypothetical protein